MCNRDRGELDLLGGEESLSPLVYRVQHPKGAAY